MSPLTTELLDVLKQAVAYIPERAPVLLRKARTAIAKAEAAAASPTEPSPLSQREDQ